MKEYHLPENLLDPKYDYDFTKIDDKGKKFIEVAQNIKGLVDGKDML